MRVAIVVCLLALGIPARAQVHIPLAAEPAVGLSRGETPDPVSGIPGSYPLCGSILLHDKEQALLRSPAAFAQTLGSGLKKTNAWGFTVGSTHAWYAYDYVTTNQYLTNSTCRGVGVHCYIFVEDSMWTTGKVNQAVVDSVMAAFDDHVPANPSKGVYQTDVDAFGNPPDVDNDPRIIILILNIRDGWDGQGGYIEGYFYGLNELMNGNGLTTSNQAEIYFLDAYPTNLQSPAGLQSAMSTTAHEFQHMIHWNYNKSQVSFVNEGCSLEAEVNCGYPIYTQLYFASEPNHYLLDWRGNDLTKVLNDYSRAARYFTYLRDQFGMGIFAPIVQSAPHVGIASISDGLAAMSSTRQFNDTYLDWAIANTLDDRSVDARYGYLYPGLEKVMTENRMDPNVPNTIEWIQPLGAKYVSFTAGTGLAITATASSPNIVTKVVEVGAPSSVHQLSSGVQFVEPNFGSTYKTVTLALMNTSATDSQQVSITASGTAPAVVTLAYENREPTGYLALAHGDTACVVFDGVIGGRLDSVRVALRRALPITGDVWSYGSGTHVLGTPLCPQFVATGVTNPAYDQAAQSYPVPYPNWVTVDLRSAAIDASNQFAVGFIYTGDSTTQQRVMVSPQPIASGLHSFAWVSEDPTPGWFWLPANTATDSAWAFLIRAYISFPTAAVQEPQSSPAAYRLDQNYPNPFNPATKIRYTVGGAGSTVSGTSDVRLVIYDVLGREVAVLVNEKKPAGTYEATFDARSLSSGVYFYRLTAGTFVQTRSMVLLR